MYALSLPTIAQVSLVARFRGKQPILVGNGAARDTMLGSRGR